MEDAFGDPNVVEDAKATLPVANTTLPLETDSQGGISWDDYCDTDYNQVEVELQEKYGDLPSFYEVSETSYESSSNSSGDNASSPPSEHWAGAKFLVTPVSYVVNFATTQLTALKNAVLGHSDSHCAQSDDASERSPTSTQKIMTSLSDEGNTSAEKPFTNQDEILEEVGAGPDDGICSPMVNLYFEEQLGLRNDSFRKGSASHIFQEAEKEEKHQIELIKQGKDGLHAVFVDHNIPYNQKTVKARELESEQQVETLLDKFDQALITYPVVRDDGVQDRHQIYIEKKDNGSHCSRFDVNKEGAIEEMPCKMFYHKFAKKAAKGSNNDNDDVIVAGIKRTESRLS